MNKKGDKLTTCAQKNIFFSYGGYKNIFFANAPPTTFQINLFQDELS